ncbi:hypothetical protein N9N82_03105 [Luminiphilus sp.]|nr:hypothetical protein [Luminiphilus sp.]
MKYAIELFDEMKPKAKPTVTKFGGVNDLAPVTTRFDGEKYENPIYSHWRSMLTRAFCPKYHAKHPTYIGTTVSDEFMTFSNFNEWYRQQYGWDKFWHLDKDVRGDGKHYSAENCILIPHALNLLLTDSDASRGAFPSGIRWHDPRGMLMARVCENGKPQRGKTPYFDDVIEATEYATKLKREVAERRLRGDIPDHPSYDEIEAAVYASLDLRAVEQRAHAIRCKQIAIVGIDYRIQNVYALRLKDEQEAAA